MMHILVFSDDRVFQNNPENARSHVHQSAEFTLQSPSAKWSCSNTSLRASPYPMGHTLLSISSSSPSESAQGRSKTPCLQIVGSTYHQRAPYLVHIPPQEHATPQTRKYCMYFTRVYVFREWMRAAVENRLGEMGTSKVGWNCGVSIAPGGSGVASRGLAEGPLTPEICACLGRLSKTARRYVHHMLRR